VSTKQETPTNLPTDLDKMGFINGLLLIQGMANGATNIEIWKTLKEIKHAVSPRLSDHSLYVTVPDGGGLFAVSPGATTIDFYEGEIIEPNGTRNSLRLGLKGKGIEEMRSLMFVTSAPISFSIDGAGKFDLEAGEKVAISEFGFKVIYLDSFVAGQVKLMAATTPNFTVFYDKYFSAEMQTALGPQTSELYDAKETAQQQIDLDLGTMGRVTLEATGKADAATDFYLEASVDNIHWFSVETEEGVTDYNFGGLNTKRYVRLISLAGGAPGDTVSLTLTASR
jgi:hypothetical protein